MMTQIRISDVTDEQIRSLMAEAGQAGDIKQVELCRTALYGTGEARKLARAACAETIESARAVLPEDAGLPGPEEIAAMQRETYEDER